MSKETVHLPEFDDVAGVRWSEGDPLGPDTRDDAVYEILESCWVKQLHEDDARAPREGHRHFKLCLNALGVLEVIATRMRLISDGNA